MSQKKTTSDRNGGYTIPSGNQAANRETAQSLPDSKIRLLGDSLPPHVPAEPTEDCTVYEAEAPPTRLHVGDCRDILSRLPEAGSVDLVFADPPFNWDVPYGEWSDGMPRQEYERFTYDWLDACIDVLSPTGSIWVNIPDDSAAEIVMHLKRRGMTMINWCIWHFRFGQNRNNSFILSKVHALYFSRDPRKRTFNAEAIMEQSDRAAIYSDARTMAKENNKGLRVPMDVWYGQYWGRIQGNNKERRHEHHNQIPEAYLERIILSCSNEGDLVLDPFCGSGTTQTVARAWNRASIGCEYGTDVAASAWQRITEVGMIRKGEALGRSTAIAAKRGSGGTGNGKDRKTARTEQEQPGLIDLS